MKKTIYVLVLVAVGAILGYSLAIKYSEKVADMPEVSIGGATIMQSTTTPPYVKEQEVLKTGSGVFGSVIVTVAGGGAMDFYDATTTDIINGNDQRLATTSLLLLHLPASPTVGTYEINTGFVDGLLVDYNAAATISSSTITYD